MPEKLTIETPEYALELFAGEIPVRGEGFLVLRRCDGGREAAALDAGVDKLRELGATRITAASRCPDFPFSGCGITVGGHRLRYFHTLEIMEVPLGGWRNAPDLCPLVMEPLSPANAGEFIYLNNNAMCDAPNATTYAMCDAEEMMGPDTPLCGVVFRLAGDAAAMGELMPGDVPEAAALAVDRGFRGRGVGRQALTMMLRFFEAQGYAKAMLKVSTANPGAARLYRDMGFVKTGDYSTWYTIE